MAEDKTQTSGDSLEDRLMARLDAIERRFNDRLSLIEGRAETRWQETRVALSQMLVVITALNENAREANQRLAEIGEDVSAAEEQLQKVENMQRQLGMRLGMPGNPKKLVTPLPPPPPR